MGPSALQHYLQQSARVLQAVGPRIKAFLEGGGRFPLLEQAWADAAYWFHEGLAEPLDTIAVPKLETAIEVLLRAQSSSGSKSRLLKAIQAFYGLTRGQFINAESQITVEKFATGFVTDRSRILHGTWSTLLKSLRDSRPTLTALVHGLLASYAFELETYLCDARSADDIEQFLSYVEARRRSPRLGAAAPD
jgi:hypothetical protein